MAVQWWFVARFRAGLSKTAQGVEIVFGQVPDSNGFFSSGDEIWLTKEPDGRWLCAQPVPGGRIVRMTKEAARRYLSPAQPVLPAFIQVTSDATI